MKTNVVSPAQMKAISQTGDVRYSSKGVEKTKNQGIVSDGKSGNGEPEDPNVRSAVESASGVVGGADRSERGLTQTERLDVWEADEKAIGIFVRSAGLDLSWKAPVGSTRPTGGGGGEHDVWTLRPSAADFDNQWRGLGK